MIIGQCSRIRTDHSEQKSNERLEQSLVNFPLRLPRHRRLHRGKGHTPASGPLHKRIYWPHFVCSPKVEASIHKDKKNLKYPLYTFIIIKISSTVEVLMSKNIILW